MPAIAIVGTGLGASIARVLGRRGFAVALISRSTDNLAAGLAAEGITGQGFAADVTGPASLTAALHAAAGALGQIEVLESSPYAGLVQVSPADVTIANPRPATERYGRRCRTPAVRWRLPR